MATNKITIKNPTTPTTTNNRNSGLSTHVNRDLGTATTIGATLPAAQEEVQEQNPYDEIYAAYESMMKANAAAQKAELDRLYSEMISTANQGYDKSANNAYINYRQGQKALPEQLSQYGITGGASESANLKLQAAYGSNLAENEYERNNSLSNIRQSQIQQYSDVNSALNSSLAAAYQQNALQAAAWEQEQKEKAEAKAKEEAAKAEQAALAATNTKRRMAELERNKNGKITENWVDETGIYHWKVVGSNTTLAKQQAAQNQANLNLSMQLADAGYSVTLKDGAPFVTSKKN